MMAQVVRARSVVPPVFSVRGPMLNRLLASAPLATSLALSAPALAAERAARARRARPATGVWVGAGSRKSAPAGLVM